jgi:hypothetical protein
VFIATIAAVNTTAEVFQRSQTSDPLGESLRTLDPKLGVSHFFETDNMLFCNNLMEILAQKW